MENTTVSSGNNENVSQSYLEELLDKVIILKANVSEKEMEKTKALKELESVSAKINEAVKIEADMRLKHTLSPNQRNDGPKPVTSNDFKEQFGQLQHILGIAIVCTPESKSFQITFNDAEKSRLSFTYNENGIEIAEMHPLHSDFEAIRDNLRATGDLLGFLAVFSRRLTTAVIE